MKHKVLVAFFGVISRSLKYTNNNFKKNLIDILKTKYHVDIYAFNNNVQNKYVDGVILNNNDIKFLNYTFIEEKTQEEIDLIIENKINLNKIIKKMRWDYTQNSIQNSIRQMYCEEQVGKFIEKNKQNYDCVIVCGPDYYILNKINLEHIDNIINKENCIYTSNVNDGQGYTNGFYIGSPLQLPIILKRFCILETLLPTTKDYEHLLKLVFTRNNITRKITNIEFVKIRSNRRIAFQGRMRKSKYKQYEFVNELLLHI
jgi:hypothetical protein